MARLASEAGVKMVGTGLFDGSVDPGLRGSFDAVLAIAVFEHIPY
jgi:hypothetical protein